MKINLKINKGFSWFKSENIFFKGYFFDENSSFYEKNEALTFLKSIDNKNSFLEKIPSLKGVFSVIFSLDESVFVFCDITRSFPLFYTFQNNEIHISDDIYYLKNTFKIEDFDTIAEIELKSTNHTYGNKTLLKNTYQVQASECIEWKSEKINNRFFSYSYAIEKENNIDFEGLKTETYIAFENSFKRLISSLKNKTVAIPLSGGFDSRLIATMLKKYNYENVVCFTYGNKNSFEIENSKKTAEKLNFKWYFIEYSDELIADFLFTDEFLKYVQFAGKLSSMPNLQEYFAVKYLKDNHIIPQDAIFIPGYAGDLLGGSQVIKVIPENLKHHEIIDLIIEKKFTNHQINSKEREKIRELLEIYLIKNNQSYQTKIASSVFEDIDIKEKIAKYIFNSASFYSYFGYEFRFPFWDYELLNHFKKIPFEYKIMKLLYDEVLDEHYFKPYEVCYEKELQPSKTNIKLHKIKGKIKPFLPTFIKQKLLKKNDWVNYQPITNQMKKQLDANGFPVKRKYQDYNEIITQWYLYFSKNKLK